MQTIAKWSVLPGGFIALKKGAFIINSGTLITQRFLIIILDKDLRMILGSITLSHPYIDRIILIGERGGGGRSQARG